MWMQSNKYLPGRPLFKSVLLFLFSTQVKLLESLETMDKESFDTKFGGVLTYTTVSLFFELRNIPVLQSVWADCRLQRDLRAHSLSLITYIPKKRRGRSNEVLCLSQAFLILSANTSPLGVNRFPSSPTVTLRKTSHIRHHWVIKSVFILNLWSSLQLPPPPLSLVFH